MTDTDGLAATVEAWLANPPSSDVAGAIERLAELLDKVKATLVADASVARKLGPLVPRLSAAMTQLSGLGSFAWVPVGNGRLAIGHRPGLDYLAGIRLVGGSHVVTLLAESEGARDVGTAAKKQGLDWLWFPMASADPPAPAWEEELVALFDGIGDKLATGAHVYIHCSAGIHRTGMISYALLRHLGADAECATDNLANLRPVTQAQVGDARIAWAENFVSRDRGPVPGIPSK